MDDVVPGVLQRLRAADIIRMAGLTVASRGQEYCRIGAVQATRREGARLSGVVVVANITTGEDAFPLDAVETTEGVSFAPLAREQSEKRTCAVEVEVQSSSSWQVTCTCATLPPAICPHATALLYQWLAQPAKFIVSSQSPLSPPSPSSSLPHPRSSQSLQTPQTRQPTQPALSSRVVLPSMPEATGAGQGSAPDKKATRPIPPQEEEDARSRVPHSPHPLRVSQPLARLAALPAPKPISETIEMLFQPGLGELRSIAREYEIPTNGLSKQELGEAILEALKQPEAVRRVVGTLDKPQRQLLATLTLAGGSITDDDLRSLFERFSLGQPDTLQRALLALQGKGLLFRTSFNSSLQQRLGVSSSLLDIGWYVPAEVRAALRVNVPVTPFDVEKALEGGQEKEGIPPQVLLAHVEQMLPAMLLVARALDGYQLGSDEEKEERGLQGGQGRGPLRAIGGLHGESQEVSPPEGTPPASLMAFVREIVPRSEAFLRFVIRLLRAADIVHRDDQGTGYLRVLPNVARLFLEADPREVLPDLFTLWLTRSNYDELYDLREEGLSMYTRSTPLNQPIIRLSELATENTAARQTIVRLLAYAPLNQWMYFAAFARFMYKLNPYFLQKRQPTFAQPHWWLEQEKGQPLRPGQPAEWMRVEGRYLARLLQGPLHWWGLTDVALSGDGNLLAFRLTSVAGWLLHGYDAPVPAGSGGGGWNRRSSKGLLEVMREIMVVGGDEGDENDMLCVPCARAAWSLIQLLEEFAVPVGVRDGQLCYRLSPEALSVALGKGQSPAALFTLLEGIAGSQDAEQGDRLRQLLAQLERWTENYGRVRLYTGVSLLEVADSMVMRELKATTSIQEQVAHAIHPALLILKRQGAAQLTEELKRRGQTPLLHEEEDYGTE